MVEGAGRPGSDQKDSGKPIWGVALPATADSARGTSLEPQREPTHASPRLQNYQDMACGERAPPPLPMESTAALCPPSPSPPAPSVTASFQALLMLEPPETRAQMGPTCLRDGHLKLTEAATPGACPAEHGCVCQGAAGLAPTPALAMPRSL